jgi:predicted DNA binding CopG/RHH family protein
MAIIKRPVGAASQPKENEAMERFIQGAPDGNTKELSPPAEEGKGVQITLRINPDQLAKVTAAAKRQGIPRASYIKRAIAMQLDVDDKNK